MTAPQTTLLVILALTLAAFIWGRFRHDVVALAALMAAVVTGLVAPEHAFGGFGHPAVITVACVLVLSQSLQHTGAIDALARRLLPATSNRLASMLALMAVGGILSGFMNNVGAMALLLPIATQLSDRLGLTPGQVLMPLAFSTILGGMTTLIGTPPNLIVSGFREEAGMAPFGFFDFTPIGLAVALCGIAFIALLGWRLVPARRPVSDEHFETGAYLTEVRVPENSPAVGLTLRAFERKVEAQDTQIVGLVRNDVRLTAPHGGRRIAANDILVLEAEVGSLGETLAMFRLTLETDGEDGAPDRATDPAEPDKDTSPRGDGDIVLREICLLYTSDAADDN